MRATTYTPGTYSVGGYQSAGYAEQRYEPTLDQPAPEEPAALGAPAPLMLSPRDRPAVHFGWEFLLLLAVAGVGFLLYRESAAALRGNALDSWYLYAAALGFVSVGAALSLRTATPNVALGPIAYGAAMFFADNSDRGLPVTAGMTALLAVGAGLVLAVAVALLRVPAWAASLAAAFGIIVWIQSHRGAINVDAGAYRPTDHAAIWFGAFAGLSVLGGLLGLAPAIRRAVGGYRPEGDAADRRGALGAVFLGLIGSSVFAAASGVLLALYNRQVTPAETGIGLTGLALGAALLGGTSVYGRLGGVFGTVFAVVLVTLVVAYADARGKVLHTLGVAAVTIGIGLIATRVMEAWARGRARPIGEAGMVSGMASGPVGGSARRGDPAGSGPGAAGGAGPGGFGGGAVGGFGGGSDPAAAGAGFGGGVGGSAFGDPPGGGYGEPANGGYGEPANGGYGEPANGGGSGYGDAPAGAGGHGGGVSTADGWPVPAPPSPPEDRWDSRWGR